jgi:hypothetical protein
MLADGGGGGGGQRKVLSAYQSPHLKRMAKVGVAVVAKGVGNVVGNGDGVDDSSGIIEWRTVRENAPGAVFAAWEQNER